MRRIFGHWEVVDKELVRWRGIALPREDLPKTRMIADLAREVARLGEENERLQRRLTTLDIRTTNTTGELEAMKKLWEAGTPEEDDEIQPIKDQLLAMRNRHRVWWKRIEDLEEWQRQHGTNHCEVMRKGDVIEVNLGQPVDEVTIGIVFDGLPRYPATCWERLENDIGQEW